MNFHRSVPLLALALTAYSAPLRAQCTTTLVADVNVVSVSAGGIQNIAMQVNGLGPHISAWDFRMIGTFSGTLPGSPWLAYSGLHMNVDRYTLRCLNQQSRLIRPVNGIPGFPNLIPLDAQGQGQVQIVVAPGAYPAYVGRTVHHGVHSLDMSLVPACGSNTIALTFAP